MFKSTRLPMASSLFALTLIAPGAQATVIQGQSDAYGLQVDLSILGGLVSVDLLDPDLLGQRASGQAPLPYDQTRSAVALDLDASVNLGLPPLATLSGTAAAATGVLNGRAASDVDGGMGPRQASARGSVADLDLQVAGLTLNTLFGGVSVETLGLASSTLAAEVAVSGDYDSFSFTAGSLIEGLSLDLLGNLLDLGALGITADVLAGASPNLQLLDINGIVGLDLVINEQLVDCDDPAYCSVEVNALRLRFDGVSLLGQGGLISGDIIIGHAFARLDAVMDLLPPAGVPSPGVLALMGLGLLGLARVRRSA